MLAIAMTIISTQRAICRHHTMTRHLGSKGVASERLTHRLSTATADATRQLTIGYGLPSGNI